MTLNQNAEAAVAASAFTAPSSTVVVGRLVTGSTIAGPRVDFPGNPAGSVEARTTLQLSAEVLERAVATSQGVLLVFENGDPALPIIVGLIQVPEVSPFQALLATPREPSATHEPKAQREARLDGDRVVLEGKREVVLKCGEATLTLRRDGKILIRGAYVETYSKGVNRIKGGAVKIN